MHHYLMLHLQSLLNYPDFHHLSQVPKIVILAFFSRCIHKQLHFFIIQINLCIFIFCIGTIFPSFNKRIISNIVLIMITSILFKFFLQFLSRNQFYISIIFAYFIWRAIFHPDVICAWDKVPE